MVEVNQEIPDRDEAELRRAVQGDEPSAASRVFDERPTSRGALDLAPGSRSYGCAATARNKMKNEENFLDTDADVIHGNWPSRKNGVYHFSSLCNHTRRFIDTRFYRGLDSAQSDRDQPTDEGEVP